MILRRLTLALASLCCATLLIVQLAECKKSNLLPQPWKHVEGAVLPKNLQMSGIAQLGPFTAIVGGCEDMQCEVLSNSIFLFDANTKKMWTPVLGVWNGTTSKGGHSHTNTSHTNHSEQLPGNEPRFETPTPATLKYPTAGLHSVAGLGGSLFVMGMCTTLPFSNVTELSKRVMNASEYYRKVQRIILLDHGDGALLPPVVAVMTDYLTLPKEYARVNASCIAHGANSLYVVGGVMRIATEHSWGFSKTADQLIVDLHATENATVESTPGAFLLNHGVTNPSIVSDADLMYIIGGTLESGSNAETVSVCYVSQLAVYPLTDYPHVPELLTSAVLHTTVVAGNIIVTGDSYRTFETFFQINPVDGWTYVENTLLPVRNASTWAYPHRGGLLLLLFGGHNTVSQTVTNQVWATELSFHNPATVGFIQSSHSQVGVSYWNETVSAMLGPGYRTYDFDHCNDNLCSIRIGTSARCDTSFVDLSFSAHNLTNVTINGSNYVATEGILLPAAPSPLDTAVPHFLYACYSPGKVGQPPSCSGEECLYEASFYVPLNSMDPMLLLEAPSPPPHSLTIMWTTKKIIIVSVIGAILLVVGIIIAKIYCFGGPTARFGNKAQQAGPPANVLGDGRYKVVERLGRGSFSVVYLVERTSDKRKFALKYIQCPDETERKEALKECEVIAKLRNHPNVIHLEDMFLSYKFDPVTGSGDTSPRNNMAYPDSPLLGDIQSSRKGMGDGCERYLSLVMEYHERGDLSKWVRKMKAAKIRIPEATVISVAHQVCSVLHYMHTQSSPIIHRDLKPENLLLSSVSYNNVADSFLPLVVSDFGLSRVMDKAFCETGVGSLPYVAPESWKRNYTTKIDIWATGCILFALCARRVEADNVVVMFSESNRPDFSSFIHNAITKTYGYSAELAHFIGMLLEVDVARRPSAEQALDCIKRRVIATEIAPLNSRSSSASSASGFGSGDGDGPRRSSQLNSSGRTSSSCDAIFEHFMVDIEVQEEIRSASNIPRKNSSTIVTSPLRKGKKTNSMKQLKNTGKALSPKTLSPLQNPKATSKRSPSPTEKLPATSLEGSLVVSSSSPKEQQPAEVSEAAAAAAAAAEECLPIQSLSSVELRTHPGDDVCQRDVDAAADDVPGVPPSE